MRTRNRRTKRSWIFILAVFAIGFLMIVHAIRRTDRLPILPGPATGHVIIPHSVRAFDHWSIMARLPVGMRCIDASEDVRGCDLDQLSNNTAYVARYYCSTNPRKVLTRDEAVAITAHGMRILAFFQNGARTWRSFDAAQAERNGRSAWEQAYAAGEPSGGAIYFCVDYRPSAAEMTGHILPYFEHVAIGMERARRVWMRGNHAIDAPEYAVGIYAPPSVITGVLTDPNRTLPAARVPVFVAGPPLLETPTDADAYLNYLTKQEWTVWQMGGAATCHRVDQPLVGFPCDYDQVRTRDNGSFTVK